MSHAHAARRAAIRSAILRYLSRHPRASDAVAGICAWWLPEEGITAPTDLVDEVLETLVAQQLIRRVRLADGTLIYGSGDTDAAARRHHAT